MARLSWVAAGLATTLSLGCAGDDGAAGSAGVPGVAGRDGQDGREGRDGVHGTNGANGTNGRDGQDGVEGRDGDDGEDGAEGEPGAPGEAGAPGRDGVDGARGPAGPTSDPLASAPARSSLVAVSLVDDRGTGAFDLGVFVRVRADQLARGTLPATAGFPLANASTDAVRSVGGTRASVVVRWLDPLTYDDAPTAPRFGANADYVAYFGDGWDDIPGAPPQWHGADDQGWLWVNHEYVSNEPPTASTAPTGQQLTLARWLATAGLIDNDVTASVWPTATIDTQLRWFKRNIGGSWMRAVRDPAAGAWFIDRSADGVRYDATSSTLLAVTGQPLMGRQHDDFGAPLPEGVVPGIAGDCSGAQTPWGTIISAEENVQDYYGDLETAWGSRNQFVPGAGFDAGALVAPAVGASPASAFGSISDPWERHDRDAYGYLTEMDPGVDPAVWLGRDTAGVGHQKLGAVGRARWENATFVTDGDGRLLEGEPIVLYAADDRRGGRIFKFVSRGGWTSALSRAETRALLADGTLYVAHFADLDNNTGFTVGGELPFAPRMGAGRWVELSVESADLAPNGAALGRDGITVGEALRDLDYNRLGGFEDDAMVRRALFTAANKVGVRELNRPEDVEWNPLDPSGTPRLYVAFTNHGRPSALDGEGRVYDPAVHAAESVVRDDSVGSIFALTEDEPAAPGASRGFVFEMLWVGSRGVGIYDAANPDNLLIDAEGGVWFGTDGNFGRNGTADALYYLDLDPAHAEGAPGVVEPTFGRALRVVAAPSDAEASGPAMSSGMGTLFFSVQHPGEGVFSGWPFEE